MAEHKYRDGKIAITENDITTNLPYVENAFLIFDHHLSETIRNTEPRLNHIIDPNAPSAARVVWDYYGWKRWTKVIPLSSHVMKYWILRGGTCLTF